MRIERKDEDDEDDKSQRSKLTSTRRGSLSGTVLLGHACLKRKDRLKTPSPSPFIPPLIHLLYDDVSS